MQKSKNCFKKLDVKQYFENRHSLSKVLYLYNKKVAGVSVTFRIPSA